MFKVILALILTACFAQSSFGNDTFDDIIQEIIPKTQLTKDQLVTLNKELGIQKLFIEGVKKIEIRGGQFVDIERSTNTIRDLLLSSMNAKSESLSADAKAKMVEITKTRVNRQSIKNILLKTKEHAYNFLNGKRVFTGSMVRRFGFDVGIVYFLSAQIDYTFPWYMISQGATEYTFLLATPVSSVATGTYIAAKSAIKYRHVIKNLGGLKVAAEHFKVYRKMKSFFEQNILKSYDLFDIYQGNKSYVLTVEKRNIVTKTFQKLGWNKSLNYENLIKYMDDNSILPKVVENIRSSDRHPTGKLIRLLNKVEHSTDANDFHRIRKHFGKYIKEVNALPEFSVQRRWVMKTMDSRSMDQLIRMLGQMPPDIPPAIFDTIWRNKVLVSGSKNIGHFSSISEYKAFRGLVENYDKDLRALFTNSIDTSMSTSQRKLFGDYIFKSLSGVGICQQLFKPKTEIFIPFL